MAKFGRRVRPYTGKISAIISTRVVLLSSLSNDGKSECPRVGLLGCQCMVSSKLQFFHILRTRISKEFKIQSHIVTTIGLKHSFHTLYSATIVCALTGMTSVSKKIVSIFIRQNGTCREGFSSVGSEGLDLSATGALATRLVVDAGVAARLQSLRTDDPLNKGHSRSVNQKLEL